MSTGTAVVREKVKHDGDWAPVCGSELTSLLNRQFPDNEIARNSLRDSSLDILSRCVIPDGPPDSNTGLVVGYVQSGKTASFTAVMAAAHDNGFRIVILLGGTKNILADQSHERLFSALSLDDGPHRPWQSFKNPSPADKVAIENQLEAWDAEHANRQTVLITLLKNKARLDKVTRIVKGIPPEKLGPVLIIDDEADQASLNTMVRKDKISATHAAIMRLRELLHKHSFLQYTATPQAPIFIPLFDVLAPNFCYVLEPGVGYVGGKTFFKERRDDLIEVIPEIGGDSQDEYVEPPKSLLQALRIFLIGVAAGEHQRSLDPQGRYRPANRSMMVHPSHLVTEHQLHDKWIKITIKNWILLLEDNGNPDRNVLLSEFRGAYQELAKTVESGLPDFDNIAGRLLYVLRDVKVQQVNSLDDTKDWSRGFKQNYPWIVVGGQKLDRGFTVEGLTVTYMPRGAGTGLADTIQQRGRFFGYKSDYLGFCRVFLEAKVLDAFEKYVDSEESMRAFLQRVSTEPDLTQSDVKRQFQMDRSLKPTRATVLLDYPQHLDLSSGWFDQQSPHHEIEVAAENARLIEEFIDARALEFDRASGQNDWLRDPTRGQDTQIHDVSEALMLEVLHRDLLAALTMSDFRDDEKWQVLLALLDQAADEAADAEARIIKIRPTVTTRRGIKKNGQISNLFMGASPDKNGAIYAGDRAVHKGTVSLQVHTLGLVEGRVKKDAASLYSGVTTLAVWLDPRFGATYISQ